MGAWAFGGEGGTERRAGRAGGVRMAEGKNGRAARTEGARWRRRREQQPTKEKGRKGASAKARSAKGSTAKKGTSVSKPASISQEREKGNARSGHIPANSANTLGWSAALHPPPMLVQVTTDCVNAGVAHRQVVFVLFGEAR